TLATSLSQPMLIGFQALREAGVYTGSETDDAKTWSGLIKLPSGKYSYDQFMASPDVQKEAFGAYRQSRWNAIKRMGLDQYIGQPVPGHPDQVITAEGLFAGAHLGGEGGLKRFLEGRGDPKDSLGTSVGSYVAKFSKSYGDQSAPVGPPDLGEWQKRGMALAAPYGPDVRDHVRSQLSVEWNRQNAALNGERQDAMAAAQDTSAAAGQDVALDASRISRLFSPDQAGAVIDKFNRDKAAGQALNAVRYAAPDDIQKIRGQYTTELKNTEDWTEKAKRAQTFDRAVAVRDRALADDPAGFVSGSPTVKPLLAAIDPQNPGPGTVAYVRASLAEQARLGVPAEDQRVLAPGQADDLIHKLTKTPPGEVDIGTAMGKLFENYGPYGHQVFGELVKAKLSGDYQVLATMDAPGQAVARADLQKVLALEDEKGGTDKIKHAAPKLEVEKIDKRLDDALAPFRATTVYNDGGPALFGTVKDTVKKLAYGYAYRGQDGDVALDNAVKGILGAKYDFEDGMPAPKGMMSTVKQAAVALLNGLNPAEIMPVPGNPDLTSERRRQIVIDAARNGRWVPNEDYSGLVLMAKYRDGAFLPVKRANGSPVAFSFKDAPGIAATTESDGSDFNYGGP
ncbi:MAG: hypothetical protein WCF85_20400, partial [Rhodospirillaceae bacterium]